MSFPTEPTFVLQTAGWSADLLAHPAMQWMREYEREFSETKEMFSKPYTTWHAAAWAYTHLDGVAYTGEEAWQKHIELYGLLDDFFHVPQFGYVSDIEGGYKCFGQAILYGSYKVPGEKVVADAEGKRWDFGVEAAFYFEWIKDASGPQGLKLATYKLYANPMSILQGAVKRGMVPKEMLLGA